MQWPARDIDTLAEFFSKEPPPDDRIEYAIAVLQSMYANAHRQKGTAARPLTDFLPFHGIWQEPEESQAPADMSDLLSSFSHVRRRN